MLMTRIVAGMFSAGMMVFGAGLVFSQGYPNKPVRIVTSDLGGGADFAARVIAQELSSPLGQRVIVENRGGVVINNVGPVLRAPPDGYTVLLQSSGIWLLPFLQDNVPYDPVKDLSPITLVTQSPNTLVVPSSLPVNSVKELIALAKSRPGELNYGTTGTGSTNHLAGELLKAMTGVNIVRIPYKGIGAALVDLLSGKLHLMMPSVGAIKSHVEAGRLKLLAVTSAQPSPLAPGVPTMAASGLPGFESAAKLVIFARAGTPAPIIDRLNREIVQVLTRPDIKEQFLKAGYEAVVSSPAELTALVQSDMLRWGKIIKDAGINRRN